MLSSQDKAYQLYSRRRKWVKSRNLSNQRQKEKDFKKKIIPSLCKTFQSYFSVLLINIFLAKPHAISLQEKIPGKKFSGLLFISDPLLA